VRVASIPEEIRTKCPSCGAALAQSETVDPYAICLACPTGHRFFVMPEGPLAIATATAAAAHFPGLERRNRKQVAEFWLSDPSARRLLNQQLAELLRTILEARSRDEALRFHYCPVCGGELSEYDQPDIWVRGLRCSQNHSWAERGGRLGSLSIGLALHAEPSAAVVRQLVSGWLKGNPQLDSNLHESVRRVLASSELGEGAA
jgi:hypothetical protein